MSFRRAVARPAGVDDLLEEVSHYEHSSRFGKREKVALRLVDAFLADPKGLSEIERAQALEYFSPKQIVDLLFRLARHSSNKGFAAALGIDGAFDERRLTVFHVDPTGRLRLGDPDGVPIPSTVDELERARTILAAQTGATGD
jgi:hypothetical protein